MILGVALIVWGAERFAEHLARAAVRLGISTFALALLLAGAEPEEMATVVAATLSGAPGIAFGDVIGTNIAMCLVALGVGAAVAPLPFTRRVLVYGAGGLPVGIVMTLIVWDGVLTQPEAILLLAIYVVYVAGIWRFEGKPPALGETEELEEAEEEFEEEERNQALGPAAVAAPRRVGRELAFVLMGLVAMVVGASILVEAVRQITGIEEAQTLLGLTVVGFATAFELVVLCWSAARRGAADIAIAGVIGSFAYNATMSLAAGGLIRPLVIQDAALLHVPLLIMLGALIVVLVLAAPRQQLSRPAGIGLLCAYPVAVWLMVVGGELRQGFR